MGFFSSIGSAFKSIGKKIGQGARYIGQKSLKGLDYGIQGLKIGTDFADKYTLGLDHFIPYYSAIKAGIDISDHLRKMAKGEEAYQGKLLEARQSDWKDEAVLVILSAPIAVLAWAVVSDDPTAMDKVKLFFDYFSSLPSWFTNLWILVVASIYGIKGTQIFRNGGKK